MRIAMLLLLAGCAAPQRPYDVAGRDPACARSCLANHSQCVSRAGVASDNRLIANDVLRSCRNATDACISTCPAQ